MREEQHRATRQRSNHDALCNGRSLRDRWKLSRSRLVSGPLTDTSFHLLVRYDTALLNIAFGLAHRSKKRNLVGGVTKIDVVWQPVDRLEDLLFDAHGSNVTGIESNPQRKQIEFVPGRASRPSRRGDCYPVRVAADFHTLDTITFAPYGIRHVIR